MAVVNFNGMLAVALSVGGTLATTSLPATVWTAETGGTQVLDIVDHYGGTGGTVTPGPGGRFKFDATFEDGSEFSLVWLDFGVGGRWPFRGLQAYGPQGPQGDPGPAGSGLPFPLPSGTAEDGSIPVLTAGGTATVWTDPSEIIGGGGGGYEGAAPGTIVRWPTPDKEGQVLPRPTSRLDLIVKWYLPAPPPEGNGYAIPGIDEWVDTSVAE